ncbi:MAG: TonB-dependent receptor [Prevotellaceae bacterium]|jgi:hypothetical protein|nr:TonB-dependent receptor [Prevotellaceae bacterium]
MNFKSLIGTVLLLTTSLFAFSQTKNITVTGRVLEGDTKEPAVQANVQLLSMPDSTYVAGNATSLEGYFTLPKVAAGKYVLKVSYVGFLSQFVPLQLTADKNVGTLTLKTDAVLLAEAVVTAQAAQVQVVEDSIIFNAAAYRTPEGAMLEELIKRLPGAEIDDSGNIKINGKSVTKLLVEGKEFFDGDIATGLKNLPVEMVDRLKTYDRQSDLARVTGIDDGEEETVIDLGIKKDMRRGWTGNIDAGVGTKDRYTSRATINHMMIGAEPTQFTLIGSANNVGGQGFSSGGGGGMRFGSRGLSAPKMGGFNFAIERKKIDLGGSVRYNHSNTDSKTINSTSQTVNNEGAYTSLFTNSNSTALAEGNNIFVNFRMEWRPDTMTNIIFRPNFSYGKNNNYSLSENASFSDDPLGAVADPNSYLTFEDLEGNPALKALAVNAANGQTRSNSNSLSASGRLQVNRKLSNNGRNLTLIANYSYNDGNSEERRESENRYYTGIRPDTTMNRYTKTPTTRQSYAVGITYSEPIAKSTYLQFRYEFTPSINKSDRKAYTMSEDWGIDQPLGNYQANPDSTQSKYAKYITYEHNAEISFRFIREKYQLNAGMQFRPQTTELKYKRGDNDITVKRNVFNFAPNIDLRYRFSKVSQLRLRYTGRPSQPDMADMLPIEDDADPNNVRIGNPGLKPSFSHNANLSFNTYDGEKQQGIFANAMFNATQNSITNSMRYSLEEGGKQYITPKNINGNWNVNGGFGFNTALKNQKFTIGAFTNGGYNNSVSYLNVGEEDVKNTATTLNLSERLNGAYRNDWFEFGLNASLTYTFERNKLLPIGNQEPYTFSYGANTTIYLPWGMNVSTNITNQARRGYSQADMNRDEWIWNAQLAQSFFKGNASISLEWNDILAQQSNIMRSFSSTNRQVTIYNSINSYVMVHFIYRLNIFGSKEARQQMQQMQRGGFGGGMGMPPGGMPPGGGRPGGGRPGGGGRPF